jgi:hypothetical protein
VAPEDQAKIQEDILEICNQAVNLMRMMRASKEFYQCKMGMEGALENEVAHLVSPMAVEGGGSEADKGDNIAFVLFGALTKRGIGGEVTVLERAHVIMKRRSG